jgi:hypothetical protein
MHAAMKDNDVRRPYLQRMKQVIDKLLAGKGDVPDDMLDFTSVLLTLSGRLRRTEINATFFRRLEGTVQFGPFKGMALSPSASWGDGHLASRLLGFYEADLHPHIEHLVGAPYDCILNPGCAEGFYAIGLARLFPEAKVYAFDIDQNALNVCKETASRNAVQSRLVTEGELTAGRLQDLLSQHRRALIVADIEGAERDLLDPITVPALAKADVIVECHDFEIPGITELLKSRFTASHKIEEVREDARNPNAVALLDNVSALDKAMITCEFRPSRQSWLVMLSRGSHGVLAGLFGRKPRGN